MMPVAVAIAHKPVVGIGGPTVLASVVAFVSGAELTTIITVALTSLAAMFAAYSKSKSDRSAIESERNAKDISRIDRVTDRIIEENGNLRSRIDLLEKQVDDLKLVNLDYKLGVKKLVAQIRSLDQVPVWVPEKT